LHGYVQTALGQIHYTKVGTGAPLVLLPAAGRSARMFAGLPEHLDGFETLAIDPPGFGRSDALAPGTTLEQLAGAIVEILDGLGLDSAAVYGLHTGNKIATALAVRHPARVRRLILSGQSHSLVPDRERRNAGIRSLIAASVDLGAGLVGSEGRIAKAAELAAKAPGGIHPGIGGNILDHMLDALEARGTPALYQANLGYDLEGGYREIAVPTLILEIATPHETAAIGLQAPAVAALIRGAQTTTLQVPDCANPLTLEDRPAELAAIIREFAR
jgi:pimeloyl-ACP methyl ester carboxylesterase